MNKRVYLWVLVVFAAVSIASAQEVIRFEINGLRFELDAETGGLVTLSHEGPGLMLDSPRDRAGLVDLACPVPEFEPLRVGVRYAEKVQYDIEPDRVKIHWPTLGASRAVELGGPVSATVWFEAADDGISVLTRCVIENQSEKVLPQVLFPDFDGFLPFAGQGRTFLRTAGFTIEPFVMLQPSELAAPFYAVDKFHKGLGWVEYRPGGWGLNDMIVGWTDLGSMRGGISMFAQRWGWDPIRASLMLRRYESDGKLRMLWSYNESINPGGRWESDTFRITPHDHGWARGIVPFRRWVHDHIERKYEIPERIRRGLGYRTIYMSQGYPGDPAGDVVYRYTDLPRLAKDAKAHGLDEMVLWFWGPVFQLPITTMDSLGTKQEFIDAVKTCRELGVSISPFISVYALANPTAARYGLTVRDGWTYHTEMVPMFNPPYARGNHTGTADQTNLDWHDEVLASWEHWMKQGVVSLVWDVWYVTRPERPNLIGLTDKLRALARKYDPESVFSGESQDKIEIECEWMDYTWNWRDCTDIRGFNNAFPAPRLNYNVNDSARVVKTGFMDNVYINVMPRKPDGINGSALIEEKPELSAALQQCARLRRQFLPYFTEGTIIGECILAEEAPGTRVTAYQHDGRLLMILLNLEQAGSRAFTCDLAPWLPAAEHGCQVTRYDGQGRQVKTFELDSPRWSGVVEDMAPLDFAIYEIMAR